MRDWQRRADPAFYYKEPNLLRRQAQIGRYTEDAQAEVRLSVLTADRMLRAATAIVAVSAYVVATAAGTLDLRGNWAPVWAFAVLAAGIPRALPWWPDPDAEPWWRPGLIGVALVAIPAAWTRFDPVILGVVAAVTAATLCIARRRLRRPVLVLAVGVLFAARMPVYPVIAVPLGGILAAGASVLGVRAIAPVWRRHPQIATWSAFAAILLTCAYASVFEAPSIAPHVPLEIAAVAVAYLTICVIGGRIRRAELLAGPGGVLSLPQSVVPLLDRSHDHAIICRLA